MKKLYRVEIERVLYVLADDESDAEFIARGNEQDTEPNTRSCEVTDPADVDPDWRKVPPFTAYHDPGYEKGEPTCAEIAARPRQKEEA